MFSVIIKNATIIDPNSPHNNLTKDILIKDGTIIKIENDISDKNTNQIRIEIHFKILGANIYYFIWVSRMLDI